MKKIKIHFNINSLLYNNDEDAIEMLKSMGKYDKYKSYDKSVQKKIVNKISLEVNDDDSIDYIKRKLSLHLFDKIKDTKNQKTCFYCFADRNKDGKVNEIIKTQEDLFKGIEIEEKKEDDEDLGLDDINLDDLSDFDEDEDESESLASVDISELFGGSKKKKSKNQKGGSKKRNIMVCHNCCKCYLFNSHFNIDDFEKYDDIFPFPELFHLSKNEQIMGYSLIDNQRKNLELLIKGKDITNPFLNITSIIRRKLVACKIKH